MNLMQSLLHLPRIRNSCLYVAFTGENIFNVHKGGTETKLFDEYSATTHQVPQWEHVIE